ncbi:hypothetical protein ACIRST_22375 [Kitasatospora sp. NPDC101447]|uniref:hypothetical protein n=1 Tax=Kitasatospora sp. NPDC101447 TaxID=3364102 RepID=UPI003812C0E2
MDHGSRITLRLPADTHTWLTGQARRERQSLNSQIVHLLAGTPEHLDDDSAA